MNAVNAHEGLKGAVSVIGYVLTVLFNCTFAVEQVISLLVNILRKRFDT
jgi:hypothetical protein